MIKQRERMKMAKLIFLLLGSFVALETDLVAATFQDRPNILWLMAGVLSVTPEDMIILQ